MMKRVKLATFTVVQSCYLYFQTPLVTELTICETAISYLTQNSLPDDLQCCRRHKIYHLINSSILSHTGFVSSLLTFDVRDNLLVSENAPYYGQYTPAIQEITSQMLTEKVILQDVIY